MAEPAVILPRRVIGKARSQVETTGRERDQNIPTDNVFDPNIQITDLRTVTSAATTLRNLYHTDGLVSSVIVSMVQMAMAGYTIESYDTNTHQFNAPGLLAAESLLAAWDTVWDYTQGYADRKSVNSLLETGLLETALTGGIGGELVLTKDKFPDRLQLFPYDTVIWKGNGRDGRFPAQRPKGGAAVGQAEVPLNLPTVFIGEALKAANLVYNLSFLASGFQRLFHYDEFIQDMRRVVRQSGSPRLIVTLDYQKAVQSAPPTAAKDPKALQGYLEGMRSDVETLLKGLAPEDALVMYDIASVDTAATAGEKADYKDLLDALSGLTASALKANPAILGLRIGGSQNMASAEAMLFTKVALLLQKPMEMVMSRALTLGVRLMGVDCYVKFRFNEPTLRPDMELEAHKTMRQARILEQLSLGFLSDEEASSALGAGSRPNGAPPLSGTGFYAQRSLTDLPTPNSDPNGRQVSSDAPTSGGGRDNTQRV